MVGINKRLVYVVSSHEKERDRENPLHNELTQFIESIV